MKNILLQCIKISLPVLAIFGTPNFAASQDQNPLTVNVQVPVLGRTPPIPVSLDGFSGEVADVLKFDLYVQGFSFVAPDAAQYQINGSAGDNVTGSVSAKFARKVILSRSYTGASLRRQAHAFADDIVLAITGKKGIGQTKIAFVAAPADYGPGEIYVSDFDGHNAVPLTHDGAIVGTPTWAPGRLALYYTSYQPGNPDIFYHDLSTGRRSIIEKFSGLNTGAAVSPDGLKLAMILSRSGSPNVWVAGADGTDLKKLTSSQEDSSPCWSPDGQWICFATKVAERRMLEKIPADGGAARQILTREAPNPTKPDWSPDGKWIAFTRQVGGGEFDICVMPSDGSADPAALVAGEDPSWSPNSRTLIFTRRAGGRFTLSVLDVFTKQVKDIGRISGNDSQPAWAK